MSLTIPTNLYLPIATCVRDPKDLIALGCTNKAWRAVVRSVLRTRIEKIFGNSFIGVREPVTVAAEIWTPLRPRTTKLSQVLEQQNKNPISDRGLLSPQNPFCQAVQSGDIGQVQGLIDCSTPIGVGIDGMFTTRDTPLIKAARNGYEVVLKLLLESGASFSVKVDECINSPYRERDYAPSEQLYLMFELLRHDEISDSQVRCATLAMRSWRHEHGFESIQDDARLQEIGREYSSRAGDIRIIQLLQAYGVDTSCHYRREPLSSHLTLNPAGSGNFFDFF